MVVRKPAHKFVDELEIAYDEQDDYVVIKHTALFTSNVKLFTAVAAEDLIVKGGRVAGVVTNWALVSMNHDTIMHGSKCDGIKNCGELVRPRWTLRSGVKRLKSIGMKALDMDVAEDAIGDKKEHFKNSRKMDMTKLKTNQVTCQMGLSYFDCLPEELAMSILSRMNDLKFLCRCLLVSKRFALTIYRIQTVCLSLPSVDVKPLQRLQQIYDFCKQILLSDLEEIPRLIQSSPIQKLKFCTILQNFKELKSVHFSRRHLLFFAFEVEGNAQESWVHVRRHNFLTTLFSTQEE